MAARVADVSRVIGWSPSPAEDSPKTWELLVATLSQLEELSSTDDQRRRILRRAEMYLASSEMELRDRIALSLPLASQEQRIVAEAGKTIRLLRKIDTLPRTFLEFFRPSQTLRSEFGMILGDWTRRMELSALDENVSALDEEVARDQLKKHGALGLLDMALHAASREAGSDAAFAPAIAMLHYKTGWDDVTHSEFAAGIMDRLGSSKAADNDLVLTSLAAAMASFDVYEAVEPLTELLLSRRRAHSLSPEWRTVCRCALARFARPGQARNTSVAAAACHFLLAQVDDVADFPILATAALLAPHVDAYSLLHGIGGAMARPLCSLGSMVRNLGMVLARDDFAPLQQQIDDLIERDDCGLLLLSRLRAAKFGSLKIIDSNQSGLPSPFLVEARPRVAESLGVAMREVPLRIKESACDRLSQMMSADAWSDEPSGMLGSLLARRAQSAGQARAL
ncbi:MULTISPECIES: hypothetical protein [unclassified Bradyrhizobium]|uniref:hypothetical protein n=1 Tax=unclassified Bradyrhizobium TaxID=2631580 RepID=UPI0028EFD2C9|nr:MULTISPECIES: hypothetical protein [unclassified Bradyrhizobium]